MPWRELRWTSSCITFEDTVFTDSGYRLIFSRKDVDRNFIFVQLAFSRGIHLFLNDVWFQLHNKIIVRKSILQSRVDNNVVIKIAFITTRRQYTRIEISVRSAPCSVCAQTSVPSPYFDLPHIVSCVLNTLTTTQACDARPIVCAITLLS